MYRLASAAASTGPQTLSASYTYEDDLLTEFTTGSTTYEFDYGTFALRSSIQIGSRTLATYSYEPRTNRLVSLDYGNLDRVQYTYDQQGRVTKQTYEDGGTASATERILESTVETSYSYVYNGSQLVQEIIVTKTTVDDETTTETETLNYSYDASGTPMAVEYNGTTYYYATNLQGDITAILNTSGTAVVTYTYDAWGNPLTTAGTLSETLGESNTLRYRGYVFDQDTDFYYLQSRYYDPELGRFINADKLVATGQGLIGNNMFSYCLNNPVMGSDPSGDLTRRQIHDLVLSLFIRDGIAEGRRTLRMNETCIYYNCVDHWGGWGFCDLYDVDSGEVWELKRRGQSEENAKAQLKKYYLARLKHHPNLPLKQGGTLIPIGDTRHYTFSDDSGTYEISYWDGGNGILWYDYVYRPSDSQKVINTAVAVGTSLATCAAISVAVFMAVSSPAAPAVIPFVVVAAQGISNAA